MNNCAFLLITFLILVRTSCMAQLYQKPTELKNFRCEPAMEGCYKTFSDFNSGKTDIRSGFSMEKRYTQEVKDSRAGGYSVRFSEGSYPDNKFTDKMWGICYNDTLYINRKSFQGKRGFDKVYCLGNYGYFHGLNPRGGTASDNDIFTSALLFGLVGGIVASAVDGQNNSLYGKFPHVMIYLLDYETGMVSPLTRFKLEKILEDDQQLLDLYEKEEHRSSMMIMHAYLDTFAERHRAK